MEAGDLAAEPNACIVVWDVDTAKWTFYTAAGSYSTSNVVDAATTLKQWLRVNKHVSVGEIDANANERLFANYQYRTDEPFGLGGFAWLVLGVSLVLVVVAFKGYGGLGLGGRRRAAAS